jgi:hypothetical protein
MYELCVEARHVLQRTLYAWIGGHKPLHIFYVQTYFLVESLTGVIFNRSESELTKISIYVTA